MTKLEQRTIACQNCSGTGNPQTFPSASLFVCGRCTGTGTQLEIIITPKESA